MLPLLLLTVVPNFYVVDDDVAFLLLYCKQAGLFTRFQLAC